MIEMGAVPMQTRIAKFKPLGWYSSRWSATTHGGDPVHAGAAASGFASVRCGVRMVGRSLRGFDPLATYKPLIYIAFFSIIGVSRYHPLTMFAICSILRIRHGFP